MHDELSHLERLSFLAVVNPVHGVTPVLFSQAVVAPQHHGEESRSCDQVDFRTAVITWKSAAAFTKSELTAGSLKAQCGFVKALTPSHCGYVG